MNKLNGWDRFLLRTFPRWGASRVRARMTADALARHYEAAQRGRRTSGWQRDHGDINTVTARALVELRLHARDLVRNNSWAARGVEVITGNTVGWGFQPRPVTDNPGAKNAAAGLWKRWAESTECDAEGRLNFAGLCEQAMRCVAESGEVLIRRRRRRPSDGLSIPLQIQILEADFLDTLKDGVPGSAGGTTIQGVEFDAIGRRAAYWLFDAHPGSGASSGVSARVPASEILHSFRPLRPGQVRGITWLAQTIAPLKDFDEYEDATLLRQKIAACFAAFVTDTDGTGTAIGEQDPDDPLIETFEPGMITQLPAGKDVSFANPPTVTEDSFSTRSLRRIAAGLGVTYEDLTGDYSNVNFSSARMARLAHWQNIHKWRWNMLIPQICDGVWAWAMDAAELSGALKEAPAAVWSAPPMPMIEPDKEGLAISRLVRAGVTTHDDMIREQGGDPESHWVEYAASLKRLDALGIKLDSDVRAVSQAGLTQERAGGTPGEPPSEDDRALSKARLQLLRDLAGDTGAGHE